MTKPIHSEQESSADVETAFGLLSDASWAQRRDDALHDGSQVVRREETADGGVTMVVSRELPEGIPGFLHRFLPRDGRAVQTDEWGPAQDGTRSGTWSADIPGAPAEIGGTMRLDPTPTGSRYVIEGTVKVRIPVIGGKAEGVIAGLIEKLAAREADVLRAAL